MTNFGGRFGDGTRLVPDFRRTRPCPATTCSVPAVGSQRREDLAAKAAQLWTHPAVEPGQGVPEADALGYRRATRVDPMIALATNSKYPLTSFGRPGSRSPPVPTEQTARSGGDIEPFTSTVCALPSMVMVAFRSGSRTVLVVWMGLGRPRRDHPKYLERGPKADRSGS